jgi:hypothetical protein
MAKFNEILTGRHNRFLTKLFNMKGPSPAPQLSSDIQPGMQFFTSVENHALEGWYRFGIAAIQTAVAASQSGIRIRNPANSNRMVVFEKIATAVNGAAGTIVDLETQTVNTDLAAVVGIAPNVGWDKRLNVGSGLVLSTAAPAGALSLGRDVALFPAGAASHDFIIEEQQEVILSPGEAIQLREETVNQQLWGVFWWRERPFEDSEVSA